MSLAGLALMNLHVYHKKLFQKKIISVPVPLNPSKSRIWSYRDKYEVKKNFGPKFVWKICRCIIKICPENRTTLVNRINFMDIAVKSQVYIQGIIEASLYSIFRSGIQNRYSRTRHFVQSFDSNYFIILSRYCNSVSIMTKLCTSLL